VQFTPNERLVQITEGPLDERLDLPRSAAIAARHHEDWRRHAEIADALQEIEAGGLLHVPVVDHRQDNVQQNQVELLLQQQDEGVVGRACCRELVRVTVLKLGKERPQYAHNDWLIVDDEDSLCRGAHAQERVPAALITIGGLRWPGVCLLGPASAAAVVNVTRTIVAALKMVEAVRDYLRVDL